MKTKTIPFDLETAKKIQAGEIEGEIKTRESSPVRLLCTDLKEKDGQSIVAAVISRDGSESVEQYGVSGNFLTSRACSSFDLVIEVPSNEPEFQPFDRVLVRDDNSGEWCLALYAYYRESTKLNRMVGGACWEQCIPYEGNENLLGTTDKPSEK